MTRNGAKVDAVRQGSASSAVEEAANGDKAVNLLKSYPSLADHRRQTPVNLHRHTVRAGNPATLLAAE